MYLDCQMPCVSQVRKVPCYYVNTLPLGPSLSQHIKIIEYQQINW